MRSYVRFQSYYWIVLIFSQDSDDEGDPQNDVQKSSSKYERKLGYKKSTPGSKKHIGENQVKDNKMENLLDEVTGKKKKKKK